MLMIKTAVYNAMRVINSSVNASIFMSPIPFTVPNGNCLSLEAIVAPFVLIWHETAVHETLMLISRCDHIGLEIKNQT